MSGNSTRSGVKGLDAIGIALVLAGILWAVFFGSPRYAELGSYSIAQLAPIILGSIGVICVIAARFRS